MLVSAMRTYSARPSDVKRLWYVIDASDMIVGRLASQLAILLRGKHKPMFTPHIDCGDNVVVVNVEKARLTGRKHTDKLYHRHSGYPGGIKSVSARNILEGRRPERLVYKAVQRMIPRGPLGRSQLGKLHLHCGSTHPHVAQQPVSIDLASRNRKNVLRSAR